MRNNIVLNYLTLEYFQLKYVWRPMLKYDGIFALFRISRLYFI